MTLPTQNQLHRPVLELVDTDAEVVPRLRLRDMLVNRFSISEAQLLERNTSGDSKFMKRVDWVLYSLKRAGLLESPVRGQLRVTEKGHRLLETHCGEISHNQLKQMVERGEEQLSGAETLPDSVEEIASDTQTGTPEERIDALYSEMNRRLADELLDALKKIPPESFERLVVVLLEKMGYGEGRRVGGSGDGGIDGIINQDSLGLEKVYVQAKRWTDNTIGTDLIYKFSGSLNSQGATKGVFITTATFRGTAVEVAMNMPGQIIRLIDGLELAFLMIEHKVGVVTQITYEIKEIDENYFVEL